MAKPVSSKKKVVKKKTSRKIAAGEPAALPDNLNLPVFDVQGKKAEEVRLESCVFDGKVGEALIHQAVVTYLANQRRGLASTKTRGEVSGGGIKPWRQKGTGRARVGSIRSPLWRGGGVTFGPKPHSYHRDLPSKMRTLALKNALNAKLRDREIMIVDQLKGISHKTKDFFRIIKALKLEGAKVRLVVEKIIPELKLATGNLSNVLLARASDVHAIEVVDCKKLVLTKSALRQLEERVKKCL